MRRIGHRGSTAGATGRNSCMSCLWVGLLVTAAMVADPVVASAQEIPDARRVPAADTTAAGVVADPYRWLERVDDPEVERWYRSQRRATESYARSFPRYDSLMTELDARRNGDIVLPPVDAGPLWLFERAEVGIDGSPLQYSVRLSASLDGPSQTILDPLDYADGGGWNRFTDLVPDRAGRRFLVGMPDGDGTARVRLYDRLRTRMDEVAERVVPGSVSWGPEERSILFVRAAGHTGPDGAESSDGGGADEVEAIHRRWIDGSRPDRVLFTAPRPGPLAGVVSRDGSWLIVTHQDPPAPPTPWPGYEAPTGEQGHWVGVARLDGSRSTVEPLLPDRDARYRILGVVDGELWLRTDPDRGTGRLVAVELEGSVGPRVREVWTPGDGRTRLVDAVLVEGGVAVAVDRGLDGRIEVVDPRGRTRRTIRPPSPGPISALSAGRDGRILFYRHGSFLRRQPVRWSELRTGEGGVFAPVGPSLDPERYQVRRAEYEGADGVRVPIFVVHRRGLTRDGTIPTVLYAYGGWGWSVSPWYHQRWAAWLEAGGAVAIANVRGGGEYGQEWHDAGKIANRENAVEDLLAAARWLEAERYTNPGSLGLLGLSAGGPTVASALLRAPELFGAAVLEVALLDLVRFGVPREFGDPDDAEEAAAVLRFSPYHQIPEGACLPPVLLATSEDDNLFPQALKTTARMQAAQRCDAPVLLHVGRREGHLPTGWLGLERHGTELLFLWDALSVEPGPGDDGGPHPSGDPPFSTR